MVVKRTSWHYWLWHRYNEDDEPKSLCSYFWTVLFSLFMMLPFEFSVGRPLMWIVDWVTDRSSRLLGTFLGLIFLPISYEKYQAGQFFPFLASVTWGFLLISAIICFMVGFIWVGSKVPVIAKKIGDTETWKLFYSYYRAVKDKVCPLITVID